MYAPWRLAFLKGEEKSALPSPSGCIFCDYPLASLSSSSSPTSSSSSAPDGGTRRAWDHARLVVTAREHAFVILNKYPYGNGHVMVVPRAHGDKLDALPPSTFAAVHELLHETIAAVRDSYRPHGINVGMNMGEAAGAGIAEHAHYHVLPRWKGDVNFMPALFDTKVISESLDDTWQRLAPALRRPEEG